MSLEENKKLHVDKVEAKFAFSQGCRWIRMTIDPRLNILINERLLFLLVNNRPIRRNDNRACARAFVPRCEHTGAADTKFSYFYVED